MLVDLIWDLVTLLSHPQAGPGQEPGSVGILLSLTQTDQATLGPGGGTILISTILSLLLLSLVLPVSGLILLSAVLTAVADVLTLLADLDGSPGVTAAHYNCSQRMIDNYEPTTYYFKQKSQTLDLN